MDSFERTIEEYKRELMRYAKQNKKVCITDENSFRQAEITPDEGADCEKNNKKYNEKYVCNRPMPPEYDGSEEIERVKVVQADTNPLREFDRNPINEEKYKDYDDFVSKNSKSGKLRVQTYASTQVFPIQNARIVVERNFEDGTHRFAEIYSDINGVAQNIILPTKDKSLSLTPGGVIPYATYTVKVTHPLFSPVVFHNVPIFDSIESLQPVAMLPANSPNNLGNVYEENPVL